MPGTSEPRLTKTKFVSGLQCTKMLWWLVHEPDAEELEIDPATQFLFDRGHEVGRVAQTYVPGGVLIDVPHRERRRRLEETAEALRHGAKVLYEAAIEHDGVMILADILERVRGGWNLIEVKSTTSVKPQHLPDVAVQTHVLRGAGLEVRRAELMHLNRECRYPDLSNLFERADVTEEVAGIIDEVPAQIRALKRTLAGPLPDVKIGDHCHKPYECAFLERCWPEPPPHAVGTLYRLAKSRRVEYESEGYRTILDLPRGEALTAIQERQRKAARTNDLVVDPGLREALDDLEPPLGYLDFETVAPPIPVWKGCRPYDAVPVQLSVHIQAAGGGLTHHEWLADGPGDPRETLARKLIEFTEGAKTILAYSAPFERRCIEDLQEHLPRLATRLDAVLSRLVDFLPIVRDRVYHPRFAGSFGLKSVAPALVPGLSYDALEIAAGDEASRMLYGLLLKSDGMSAAEKKRLRQDLLKYCRMDTEALVGMHRELIRLA